MRYVSWIITVPLLAIGVIFAVNHRQSVEIDLWPLPFSVEPPLYLIVLLALFAGFLLGGLVTWWSQGRHRRRARERRFRIEELEREVTFLKRKLERTEEAARTQSAEGGAVRLPASDGSAASASRVEAETRAP